MRRTDVIGLPVLTFGEGRRLGEVGDLLVNAPDGRVIGLLLAGGNALLGHRVYPFEEVRAIGDGAVLVSDPGAVLLTRRVRRIERVLRRHTELVGKRLVSERGDHVGVIDDLVFDPASGRIQGFEVSGGFVRDVVDGKVFVPVSSGLRWGSDAVICTGLVDG